MGSAELRRERVLGGPKLAAPTVTHIERKLAPTISPVSAIWQSLFQKNKMPLAAFQQNWVLWMSPEWGSKSGPKIGFADRASPTRVCWTSFLQVWRPPWREWRKGWELGRTKSDGCKRCAVPQDGRAFAT